MISLIGNCKHRRLNYLLQVLVAHYNKTPIQLSSDHQEKGQSKTHNNFSLQVYKT